jgi:glycosyltransferase involved in cell wall biosynthesis
MSQADNQPLLTLLFPLYKSKPFLDNLIAHFEQLTSPDFNFIVSDRHCFDNTLELLKQKYGNDPRFSFIAAKDSINWVKHYNLLIDKVTGKYFSFVPHDDRYRPDYFPVLVNELEQKPSAILAFSEMYATGETDWVPDYSIFRERYKYPFTAAQYISLLYSNIIGVAFRGVFRTSKIKDEGLYIKENDKVTMFQDYYWIFALFARGDFIYTEKTSCTKFFRKSGASGEWDYNKFFKKNRAARKILYEYTYSSPIPVLTKFSIHSGLEMRRLKVRLSKMMKLTG